MSPSTPENPGADDGSDSTGGSATDTADTADVSDSAAADSADSASDSGSAMSGGRWTAIFVIVVVILVAFAILVLYMLRTSGRQGVTEDVWGRRLYIYGSAEAIAFTAVGWLFGREVHRSAADSARKQADAATKAAGVAEQARLEKSVEATEAKTTGEMLARAVKAADGAARRARDNAGGPAGMETRLRRTGAGGSERQFTTRAPGDASGVADGHLAALSDLVDQAYPNIGN